MNDKKVSERLVECAAAEFGGLGLQKVLGVEDDYLSQVQDKAHELYLMGRHSEAETLCRGLIALAPKRFYPHLLLADVLRHLQAWEESNKSLETALELAPDNALVRLKVAQASIGRGEISRARELLCEIEATSPWGPQAQFLNRRCMFGEARP